MAEIALPTYAQSQEILEKVALIDEEVWRMKGSISTIRDDVHTKRDVFSEEFYLSKVFTSLNPAEVFYVGSSKGGIFGGIGKLDDDGIKVNIVLEVDGTPIDMFRIGGGLSSFVYMPVPFESTLVVKAWSDSQDASTPLSVFIFA